MDYHSDERSRFLAAIFPTASSYFIVSWQPEESGRVVASQVTQEPAGYAVAPQRLLTAIIPNYAQLIESDIAISLRAKLTRRDRY